MEKILTVSCKKERGTTHHPSKTGAGVDTYLPTYLQVYIGLKDDNESKADNHHPQEVTTCSSHSSHSSNSRSTIIPG